MFAVFGQQCKYIQMNRVSFSPRQVTLLLEKYDWIADERQFFGQPNSPYDFSVNDPKEAERRIQKLTETKDKLAKNVNMRAMNLLGSAEEQVSPCVDFCVVYLMGQIKIGNDLCLYTPVSLSVPDMHIYNWGGEGILFFRPCNYLHAR